MSPVRDQLLRLLAEMSALYPEWRFGQLVANVAMWARQPTEPQDTSVWEVEDEEMIAAIERHLKQSRRDAPAEVA